MRQTARARRGERPFFSHTAGKAARRAGMGREESRSRGARTFTSCSVQAFRRRDIVLHPHPVGLRPTPSLLRGGKVAALKPPSAIAARARMVYNRPMTQSHRPVGPGDHVFLVDGSSFVFRAYFQSIRQDQKYNYRSDRLPVGAVRLFAAKVLQFLRDGAAGITPTHIAIIFDKSENSFRREIYPAVQGASAGAAGRPRAAVSADARDRARLRPDADRAGPLRGRRSHRDLRAAGARARRRRADRLGRQGSDAA